MFQSAWCAERPFGLEYVKADAEHKKARFNPLGARSGRSARRYVLLGVFVDVLVSIRLVRGAAVRPLLSRTHLAKGLGRVSIRLVRGAAVRP
jgi:hypothetical protein